MKIAAYLIEKIGSTVSGHFHPSLWLSESHELLVTNGFHGIQPRRFHGWVRAENQAHRDGNQEGQKDGTDGHDGGPSGKPGDHFGQGKTHHHTQKTARKGN